MRDRINLPLLPPFFLVAHGMDRPVVRGAEGHDALVAYLAAHGTRLGKTYVMCMARGAAAHEAGLTGHKAQVFLVPDPVRCTGGQGGLVDLAFGTGAVRSLGVAGPIGPRNDPIVNLAPVPMTDFFGPICQPGPLSGRPPPLSGQA